MYRVRYAVLIAAALLFVSWALAQRGAGEAQQGDPPPAQSAPEQAQPGQTEPPPGQTEPQEPPPGQAEPTPDLNVVGERELQGTVAEVQDAHIEGTPLIYKVALLETDQGMVVDVAGTGARRQGEHLHPPLHGRDRRAELVGELTGHRGPGPVRRGHPLRADHEEACQKGHEQPSHLQPRNPPESAQLGGISEVNEGELGPTHGR
jgi:hypothetical protein